MLDGSNRLRKLNPGTADGTQHDGSQQEQG